jgi:hypothetical protein
VTLWVPDDDVPRYDHTKPIRRQQAPLKPEYQALFEASIKGQDSRCVERAFHRPSQ